MSGLWSFGEPRAGEHRWTLLGPHQQPDVDQIEDAAEEPNPKDEGEMAQHPDQDGRGESAKPLRDGDDEGLATRTPAGNQQGDEQSRHEQVLQERGIASTIRPAELADEQRLKSV